MPRTPRPSDIKRTDDVDFIEGSRPLPTGREAREAERRESTATAVVGLANLFGRRA